MNENTTNTWDETIRHFESALAGLEEIDFELDIPDDEE